MCHCYGNSHIVLGAGIYVYVMGNADNEPIQWFRYEDVFE